MSDQNKHKLLIYKDILLKLPWLRQWIAREKILTVVFEDGSQVAQKVLDEAPTVILMDVRMPGMGGLDCAYMLRADKQCKDVGIVVISDVFAYSLVHQAEVAGVDLFTDAYHMPIKVLRFLKQSFGFSEEKAVYKQNKAHLQEISQRLKDRYPLQGKAIVTHAGSVIQGMFENISLEGTLIRLTQMPPQGAEVYLQWTLPNQQSYAIYALAVRQSMVDEPKDEYVWVVGLKFLDMAPAMLEKLDQLIVAIAGFYEKKFEFVDFQRIRQMLQEKEAYFAEILEGRRTPQSIVERSISQVKAYERDAFSARDDVSRRIAQSMALRIIARVLRKALDWVQINPEEGLRQCLPLIIQLLEAVDQTEDKVEALLLQATKEDDKEQRRQLIESSNLLSGQKDQLVQYFYQRCGRLQPEGALKEHHEQMLGRYKQLQSYANLMDVEEKVIQQTSVKQAPLFKASESTLRAKKKQEILRFKNKIRNALFSDLIKYAAVAMTIMTMLAMGIDYVQTFVEPDDLSLSLVVQRARLTKNKALTIQTTQGSWSDLSLEQKVRVMSQVEGYLTRMNFNQAKLLNKEGKTLAAVMSNYSEDQKLFYPLFFD